MTNNTGVQISIIVPAYNVEKYIKECFDSVLSQQDVDYELICINDGSTDSTGVIINQYSYNKNIKIYSQDNKGLSATRNRGVQLSTGKYIYFLDADDKLANENILHNAVVDMDEHNLDMLEFDADSFFESKELEKKAYGYKNMYHRHKEYGLFEHGKDLFAAFSANEEYYSSSCIRIYKRTFLIENNLFFKEGILYEDNLHTLACYLYAQKVKHTNKTIMLRRVRNNSIMQLNHSFHNFYSYVQVYYGILELWEKCSDEVVNEYVGALCEAIKKSAVYIYEKLPYNEKSKISSLNAAFKYRIQKDFLNSDNRINEFEFPYNLYTPNDHIVLYGAGSMGKGIYKSAIKDEIVKIEGIFDARGKEASEIDIDVLDIAQIPKYKQFKWLISIEKKEIADSVKELLLNNGVQEKDIKWAGRLCQRNDSCMTKIDNSKFIKRHLKSEHQKRMYVLMQPEHGNLGDYAISLGEKLFLDDYFSEYEKIWVTTSEWLHINDELKYSISENDVLFLNGGGYFGDLWTSGSICKEIINSFPNNRIILFPNNLTYKNNNFDNNVKVNQDIEFLKKKDNVCFFIRDINSFKYLKGKSVMNCYYAPDMALYLDSKTNNGSKKNGNILLCLRSDKEKVVEDDDLLKLRLKEFGFEFEECDIHLNQYLSLEDGYETVNNYIKKLQEYSLVITDRLHAMIMSVLADVPCIATDNSTGKVSGVYPWVQNQSVQIVKDLENIDNDLLTETILHKSGGFIKPKKEYELMSKIISDFIC